MNPALSQEFHLFCEQEHPQRHANTDKNPYCVYGTLNVRLYFPTPTSGASYTLLLLIGIYFHFFRYRGYRQRQ